MLQLRIALAVPLRLELMMEGTKLYLEEVGLRNGTPA